MTLYRLLPETRSHGRPMRTVQTGPVTALIAQVALVAALAETTGLGGAGLGPVGWVAGVTCGVIMNAALAGGLSRYRVDRLGPADWVTLARATLAVGVAALIAGSFEQPAPLTLLVSLTALALALDAVDGWVARRTTTTGALGARFDAEVDAFLILVLSVFVARSAGAWVLAIGAARYVFLAAGWPLPWLREPLPARYWRKVVAATQGIVLAIAAAGVLPPALTGAALVVALALLAESFGRDVWWLWSRQYATHPRIAAVADPSSDLVVTTPPGPGGQSGRARRNTAVVLTVLAALLVWVILVAPDQPKYLTLSGFLRIPLEGVVLIAVALCLPAVPRRIVAVIAGLALALVVFLKVLDFGFFTTFNRPFDPIGDTSSVGIGLTTLRELVGRTEADLILVGIGVGVVVLVAALILSMLRLTKVVADNRRPALRVIGGVGAVWALCWVFGAQLISHTPIASALAAGVVVDGVKAVQADIHDQSVFAGEIKHDSLRDTPTNQLLTGLRGKDVLLVFVEAYGQQAVQGRSFSPEVDAALSQGDRQLASAGFAARSGFLTSSTYGGISWLAHSTLQSGVWVNSQRRYDQLVGTNRFTLSDAFRRAGWRTIDDVPSNDYDWAQGTSYYHYDKLYDRRNVGYRGPTFTYASMPDQYTYAALQRLELSKAKRPPLFAEVDTVSSHMPWNRIPEQIPWNEVGNGSVFNRVPSDHETGAFWSNPPRVQAAYGRSIVYSLNSLISFVKHLNDKKLVMIMVGDHQPLPIVSGHNSNHDVPISVIAHDPNVLKQIGSWGWGTGLRPKSDAPVWPMSAFRNRFLGAFDSKPASR
ncbi:MAG TPA: CDP-alcohol phosphatidyltransferase family protein [Solirubrobacteraceae bacterium]|nr:CDP-alcohol phosphatidyltransferase family protein [Solirubrobacteraceae bacterium]